MKAKNNIEIERKFIVSKDALKESFLKSYYIKSGYTSETTSSRVNFIIDNGVKEGYVTFKGKGSVSRKEFEYKIPGEDAEYMVNDKSICPYTVEKERYNFDFNGNIWEIDRYITKINCDDRIVEVILAELELDSEDQEFDKPNWVKLEVTNISAFKNHKLAMHKIIPEEYLNYFEIIL